MSKEYPSRAQCFAHKFVRLLHKAAVAAEIGRDAFSLLVVVAHTEDAMRYRGAAKFWNSQLIETLGFTKWDQFDKARRKAIESGWLSYSGDGKRTSGEYFVTIPDGYEQISDAPIEEACTLVNPENGYDQGYKDGYKQGMIEGTNRVQCGVQTGYEQGEPSSPIPIPKETQDAVASKVVRFTKPTVQQVIEYVLEISATVDGKEFVDHYESNGWKVGRNAMKDWRATVRQWNARNRKSEQPKKKPRLPDTSTPEGMSEIAKMFTEGLNARD